MTQADRQQPNPARMYDVYLGGDAGFPADIAAANQLLELIPETRDWARANRAFLGRAVRFMVKAGISQFLDLGSGLPTVGNVHEVAQARNPQARIVYVDIDSVAVAHSRQRLDGNDRVTALQADLRNVDQILGHPEVDQLLDLDQPVGLLMVAVLHFIPDADDPAGVVRRYLDRLAPGSYLAISHASDLVGYPDRVARAVELSRGTATPVTLRDRDAIAPMFHGLPLVDPGLVQTQWWRPTSDREAAEHPEHVVSYAAVARVDG